MANNFIAISTTLPKGVAILNAATQLSVVRDQLTLIKAAMDNMTAAADFTLIESTFGIPTGKGQTVYNLIAGAVSTMAADTNIIDLTAWLGITR